MSTWMKRGLLVCAIFLVTWVMFITYWSGANHMPDGSDVVLSLLVLPAGFLLLIWGVSKARTSLAAAAAAKAAEAPAAPQAGTASAEPTQHPERRWTLAIVATALRSPFGADAGRWRCWSCILLEQSFLMEMMATVFQAHLHVFLQVLQPALTWAGELFR
ncbi:hypothetical protein [Herbaspirillum sp. B65]|uniref:hypothetical protein n=1 Tax=Herbaspirillum sp. B65 TaxID=137708 RepID=UPI00034A8CA9|nr:hypothetical protein [Herbaspirillum sp. B65]